MKIKKLAAFFLVFTVLAAFSGCGDASEGKGGRETVTIAFWGDQLTESYGSYLRDKFPDVDLVFYGANNSTDFYKFKNDTDNLPDILTVRRFALRDVAPWKDSLMDLSDTELVSKFGSAYIHNYSYSDGTVNWLPVCAEIDSILVNKTLLEENGLTVPQNYSEFVQTCAALTELGIRPFQSNFIRDYTCMEMLQGLSVTRLTSLEGREWRQLYESGQTDELSEEVWLPIFERMFEFMDYTGVTASDLEMDMNEVYAAYANREVAMIRGTGDEARFYGVDGFTAVCPYFGETEEDNWYLTYPMFQVAAREETDPARRKLILDIMDAMVSPEGFENIAGSSDIVSYAKDVETDFSPMMSGLAPCVEDNRLYIRLASSDMFSVSKQVVQGMITGEYKDARAAFDAFNAALKRDGESGTTAAHIDKGYAYAFEEGHGSRAASAVMNTVREELGTQLLVGQSFCVSGDIKEGDYTEEQLGFLTMSDAVDVLLCDMTGEQLRTYMEYVLTEKGQRGSVINDSTLYVSSGFETELGRTDEGYVLERLTVGGEEINAGKTYSIAVLGNDGYINKEALAAAGVTDFAKPERAFKQIIADRLTGGGQLAEPTDYVKIN